MSRYIKSSNDITTFGRLAMVINSQSSGTIGDWRVVAGTFDGEHYSDIYYAGELVAFYFDYGLYFMTDSVPIINKLQEFAEFIEVEGTVDCSTPIDTAYMGYTQSTMTGITNYLIANDEATAKEAVQRFENLIFDDNYGSDDRYVEFENWLDANNVILLCSEDMEFTELPHNLLMADSYLSQLKYDYYTDVFKINVVAELVSRF